MWTWNYRICHILIGTLCYNKLKFCRTIRFGWKIINDASMALGRILYLQQSPYMEFRHVAPLLFAPHFAFCETGCDSREDNTKSQLAIWTDVTARKDET